MRVFEAKIVYSLVSLGEEVQLTRPEKIADYLRSAFDENPMQEAFYCVYLDRKNHPLGRHLITLGTLNSTLVSPREVFRGAILAGAAAIVVAHNHPSGDPSPSAPDITVTRMLREAAKVLDIELLDHVIVGELRKLVGPGRRITAVLRRANGRFVIYTEPDTSDRTPDITQPGSLKQSSQPFIDVPLGAAHTIG